MKFADILAGLFPFLRSMRVGSSQVSASLAPTPQKRPADAVVAAVVEHEAGLPASLQVGSVVLTEQPLPPPAVDQKP